MNLVALSKSGYYDKLKNLIVAFFLFVLTGRFVNLYWMLPHKLDTLAFMGISFCAVLFIGIDLITNKSIYNAPNVMYLLFFFVSCAVSCLIYIEYGWGGNLKSLISIIVSCFFLYSFATLNGKEKTKKLILFFQKFMVIAWCLLAVISIGTFVVQYSNIFYSSGTRILIGCIENRLFGVFSDPNYASIVSILTMIFSVAILNYKDQSKFIRVMSIINIVVQFVYITLAASRTGEVCLLLVILVASFVLSYKFVPQDRFSTFLMRILCAGLVCVAVHYSIVHLRYILSYIPSIFESVFGSQPSYERSGLVFHQVSMERPDVVQSTDISNLRFRIWGSAIDIFKTTWIFGASPRNALLYAQDIIPDTFIVQRGYDAHNFYVATLLYTGALGVIFLGYFLLKSAFLIVSHYVKRHFMVKDVLLNSLVISTICIAASGMFLSEILFITTVGSFFFWLFLGYIMHVIENDSEDR